MPGKRSTSLPESPIHGPGVLFGTPKKTEWYVERAKWLHETRIGDQVQRDIYEVLTAILAELRGE